MPLTRRVPSLYLARMHIATSAIVLAVRPHGEAGAIVRLLTPGDGLQAGYVRGGRSRRLRPVLQAGNLVEAEFRARTETQLAALTVELTRSRAPLTAEPLAAAAIEWSCGLAAVTLPEGHDYPPVFQALDGLLAAIEAAPSARGWGPALVRYELLLLAELGFGIDLSACVASGARDDLAYVSPRSGQAVSRTEGAPFAARLLPLPPFLRSGDSQAGWGDVIDGLILSGHFIERDLFAGPRRDVLDARTRLLDRLRAIAG